MSKFKVGDKIKYVSFYSGNASGYSFGGSIGVPKLGDILEISAVKGNIYSVKGSHSEDIATWSYMEDHFEINKNNYKNMTIKERFVLALTPEPQKSFRKAGITNGDDLLTDEGTKIFLSWLLHSKYADEFKKAVVLPLLEEEEETKKD